MSADVSKILLYLWQTVETDQTLHSVVSDRLYTVCKGLSDPILRVITVALVCVEVIWPSQPTGVMSSLVTLPNHTFSGQP